MSFSFFHCKTHFFMDLTYIYVLGMRVHPWNLESYLFAKAERLPVRRSRSRFNPGMRFPKAKDVSTWLSVRRPSRRLPPSLPSPPWRPSVSAPPDSRCADPRAENKSQRVELFSGFIEPDWLSFYRLLVRYYPTSHSDGFPNDYDLDSFMKYLH
jgi:hypothetical protein